MTSRLVLNDRILKDAQQKHQLNQELLQVHENACHTDKLRTFT